TGAAGRHLGAAVPAAGAGAGGGRLYQGLPRAARREAARLRGHGVRHGPPHQPGRARPQGVRGFRPQGAAGPRVLDALGRDRLRAISRLTHRSNSQLYSITSLARSRVDVGTVRPSAFAVFRLTTSVNLVGACTGRSAGFSPLRMRSAYEAASLNESATSTP